MPSTGELDDINEDEEADQFDSSAVFSIASHGMGSDFESSRSNSNNNSTNNNNQSFTRSLRKTTSGQSYNDESAGSTSNIARRLERMNRDGHNRSKRWEDRSLEFKKWGGRNPNQSIIGILTHLGDDDEDDSFDEDDEEEEELLEPTTPEVDSKGGSSANPVDKDKKAVANGGNRHGHHHHHHHKKKGNVFRRARRRVKKRIAATIQPLLPDTSKSFEQLIRDDKRREKVANNCEEPFYKLPFHFRGTVLRVISTDILFWSTMMVFVAIRLEIRMRDRGDIKDYENLSSNLGFVGGFMSFFLASYVNQNHVRYFSLHGDVMTLMGRVNDVATMTKACLPMERARRIVRFMNTAHVCAFTGLSQNYSKINFLNPLDNRFALLTDDEYDRITDDIDVDAGPKAVFELLTWVMIDIRDAQDHQFIDSMEAHQLREQVLKFRSTVAKIFVTCTRPIPFFYVHFLAILTAVYCPLFAVSVAFQTGPATVSPLQDAISFLVVILQSLFTIGLRILGQQLSDPFGGELIDLQIARYVNMILNGSNQILSAKRLPSPSLKIERELKACMISLGPAFDDDDDEEVPDNH